MVRQSSPRTRGCTGHPDRVVGAVEIVPAHAGVYRRTRWMGPRRPNRPRARGGVPGLSVNPETDAAIVPAHAGVYRSVCPTPIRSANRPRARGGVPTGPAIMRPPQASSPRTRGCTVVRREQVLRPHIVPAHAGVYRSPAIPSASGGHRPRARGGVPQQQLFQLAMYRSSPRTRGCTGRGLDDVAARRIVPVHAASHCHADGNPEGSPYSDHTARCLLPAVPARGCTASKPAEKC